MFISVFNAVLVGDPLSVPLPGARDWTKSGGPKIEWSLFSVKKTLSDTIECQEDTFRHYIVLISHFYLSYSVSKKLFDAI